MTAKRKDKQPQQQPPVEPEAPKKKGVFVCKGKALTCGTKIKAEGDEITEKDGFDENSLSALLKRGIVEIIK